MNTEAFARELVTGTAGAEDKVRRLPPSPIIRAGPPGEGLDIVEKSAAVALGKEANAVTRPHPARPGRTT